jgi:microcin C transport system substrate-binding protein
MRKIIYSGILFLMVLLFASCDGQGGQSPALSQENIVTMGSQSMPNSLNFFVDFNTLSIQIGSLLYESFCERDAETYDLQGLLAESWTVSDDKLTFTFVLDKDARWTDGTPVTTEDVMFTYETIMDPENLTSIFRIDYENSFDKVYAIDERTVVFKAKNRRWKNFNSAYSFMVLPKHEYEGKDFNRDFGLMLPPGSGPYTIERVEPERFIMLKKREDYWRQDQSEKKGEYNFESIMYKFISEDAIRLEALKKGDLDLLVMYNAKDWIEWTRDNRPAQVEKNWILAKKVFNYQPQGIQGFHMNLRRDIFKDIRVRKALAYLLNVDLINEKIMFNQYIPLYSYFPAFFNLDDDLPRFPYDPEQARQLLAEAGWNKVDSDGVLLNEKGQRLEIEFLYTHSSLETHISIFKEDCAKVGVRVNLTLISPASYRKKVFQDHDFDFTWVSWSTGGLFPEVESLWKSDRADVPNTNNITGYKNPELDILIETYLEEYDEERRVRLLKQIDLILTNDVPTVLLWGAPYARYLYWNKFAVPPNVLKKYSSDAENSALTTWKLDQGRFEALLESVEKNTTLPDEVIEIFYDQALKARYAEISD